ncbi:hypothetical protein C8R43DRAFT_87098 [Mycena crocata]|nr:hypothetical protein C8R43DRAFT_87098 [Mycena crocata]
MRVALLLHVVLCHLYRVSVASESLCGDSPICSLLDSDRVLFTPEQDNELLTAGTYIATGLSGIEQLASYLDTHPESTITHLLLSDSTVRDVDTRHGYASFRDFVEENGDWVLRALTSEEEEVKAGAIRHNAEVEVKLRSVLRDIRAPLARVLERAAPSLETLSYLAYLEDPDLVDEDEDEIDESHDDPRISALLSYRYPALRRFTFRNNDMPRASSLFDDASRFPSITYLHLARQHLRALAFNREHFPRLTHLRATGLVSSRQLPAELNSHFHSNASHEPVPTNLTLIVQPGFDPMLSGGWCGTPGAEYYDLFATLAKQPHAHVILPIEEDYRRYVSDFGVFPLRGAVGDFLSGIGDIDENGLSLHSGEWRIPDPVEMNEDAWWWTNPQKAGDCGKDETEL